MKEIDLLVKKMLSNGCNDEKHNTATEYNIDV